MRNKCLKLKDLSKVKLSGMEELKAEGQRSLKSNRKNNSSLYLAVSIQDTALRVD